MSIFNLYQKVDYSVNNTDTIKGVDIHSVHIVKQSLKDFRGISYRPYVVKNGERPDQVSYQFYNTPDYDWIILLVNDMYSVYDDWPKGDEALLSYMVEKYGSLQTTQSTIKYYYNASGDIIDFTTYTSLAPEQRTSETIYEYETRLNTNKSKIKVVRADLIGTIQTALRTFKSPILT